MNKEELLILLKQLGVRPSRRLGQNFLLDRNLLEALIRDFNPRPGEQILEIGPGTGVLTEQLLTTGCRVTAVEIDHRLCSWLRKRFAVNPGFRLLEADACKVDYDHEFQERHYRCLANLPYAVSSPWLMRMIKLKNRPAEMSLLVQKELAERLTAAPETKPYGGLTLAVGLYYHSTITRRVPPEVFYPPPEISSASLRLQKNNWVDRLTESKQEIYLKLLKIGFSRRRKQLLRLLTAHYPEASLELKQFLQTEGFTPTARAEELTSADFLALAEIIEKSVIHSF